jgi:hypothetical protein
VTSHWDNQKISAIVATGLIHPREILMPKQPADTNRDAAMHAEATIAAILTLAVVPQVAGGHSPETVIHRYKEVLQALRAADAWN